MSKKYTQPSDISPITVQRVALRQNRLFQTDPQTGDQLDDFHRAESWRKKRELVWIYNPWTGKRRTLEDITDDMFGRKIQDGICQYSVVLKAIRDQMPLDEILKLMESTGCNVNENIGDDEESVLMLAAYHGLESLVAELLKRGANPRAYSKEKGATVLCWGAKHSNILQILKETDAILDVNTAFDPYYFTPLMQTIDISLDSTGFVPKFDYALIEDRMKSVRILLELGADVNAVNNFGRTAIMGAAYTGSFGIVELLLERNPNLDIICKNGKSVFDYAATSEIKNLLKERGAVARRP